MKVQIDVEHPEDLELVAKVLRDSADARTVALGDLAAVLVAKRRAGERIAGATERYVQHVAEAGLLTRIADALTASAAALAVPTPPSPVVVPGGVPPLPPEGPAAGDGDLAHVELV